MTMATINMITMSLVMYSGYKDYEFWNDVNKTNKKLFQFYCMKYYFCENVAFI